MERHIDFDRYQKFVDAVKNDITEIEIWGSGNQMRDFIHIDDIIFVQSDGNYSTIYLKNNQKKVVTKKLKDINNLLPENSFFRTHNSYIVNLNKIKEFLKNEGYLIMESNHKIPVARQRKTEFLDKI